MADRVIQALQALGGAGTTQDITRIVRARPENVSAHLSELARKGRVTRAGRVTRRVRRWNGGSFQQEVTLWRLP